MRRLKLIGITTEDFWNGEAKAIEKWLQSNLNRLHIRKPNASIETTEKLLKQISPELMQQISLHDHYDLTQVLPIGGIHLNRRNPIAPLNYRGVLSRSCHSIEEIIEKKKEHYHYLFLSPIYTSISKKEYHAAFTKKQLQKAFAQKAIDPRIFALGGITPSHLEELANLGFGGAAMLGYLWGDRTSIDIDKRIEECYNLLRTEIVD